MLKGEGAAIGRKYLKGNLTNPEQGEGNKMTLDCIDNKITCHICGYRRKGDLIECPMCHGKTEEEWEGIRYGYEIERAAKIVKDKLKKDGKITPTDSEWKFIPNSNEIFYDAYNSLTHGRPKNGMIEMADYDGGRIQHINDRTMWRSNYPWRFLSEEQEEAWGINKNGEG